MIEKIFSLDAVYALTGIVLFVFAAMTFADKSNPRRIGSGLFWLLLGAIFAFGGVMPYWLTGVLVLTMVAIDGLGKVGRGSREEQATGGLEVREPGGENLRAPSNIRAPFGNQIFVPVIAIPVMTFFFAILFRQLGMDANRGALVGLGIGGVAAMVIALGLTRSSFKVMMNEGRRLNEAMGAVNILPQLLASLGVIFTAAKVGDLIAGGILSVIPGNNLFLLVLANCLGMALFTIVMGNSFAAFPVIATGVLVPLIIKPFGVNPAMAAIITLTAGSSGTLMTPMAANFNIVPAALLNLRDQYGVIKFQLPYALTMWAFHVLLLWLLIKVSVT
ncbi:MAG: DUF979 domain-containing protein [Acidobacteriota bacterium]